MAAIFAGSGLEIRSTHRHEFVSRIANDKQVGELAFPSVPE
jgi:hypothetical protein